ncbi:MAG TPA: hypothetical protein VN622_02730 [Clostridia bacterium]|nr:hypothetical protein [Clostridia bacterium]
MWETNRIAGYWPNGCDLVLPDQEIDAPAYWRALNLVNCSSDVSQAQSDVSGLTSIYEGQHYAGFVMTKTIDAPMPSVEKQKAAEQQIGETTRQPLCVEFVRFCKEQYLSSQAANTFFHVLHNHRWDEECKQIRENMRPDVDALFGPVEQAISEGRECKDVLQKLIVTLTKQN